MCAPKTSTLGAVVLTGLPLGIFLLPGNNLIAQEDTGAPRPARRVQLYPERSTDLSPHEKEYLQNQSQKHEKARREARAHLDALRVELAWLADPLLFAQPPSIKAVGKDEKFVVELRGVVSSNQHRQRALDLAEKFAETPIKDKILVLVGPASRRASVATQELQAKAERHLADKLIEFSQDLHIDDVYPDGVVKVSGRVLSYEDKVSVSRSLRRLTGCMAVDNRCEVGPMMQDGEMVTIITSDGNLCLPGRIQEKTMGPVVVVQDEKPALRDRPVFVPVKAVEPPMSGAMAAEAAPKVVAPKAVVEVSPTQFGTNGVGTNDNGNPGAVAETQVIEVAPPSALRNPKPIINTPLTPPARTRPVTDRMSPVSISQSGRVVRPAREIVENASAEKTQEEIPLGSVERTYQGKPIQLSGSVRILPKAELQKRSSAELANAGATERKRSAAYPRPENSSVVAKVRPESNPLATVSKPELAPKPGAVATVPIKATGSANGSESAVIPASAGTTGTIEIEPPVSPSLSLSALVDLARKACGSYALDVSGKTEEGISRITIRVRDHRCEAEVLRRVMALSSFGHPSVKVDVERMR